MNELIEKLEQVDQYFIDKSYYPNFDLRLNIRSVIDYLKVKQILKIKQENKNTFSKRDIDKQRDILISFVNNCNETLDINNQIPLEWIDEFLDNKQYMDELFNKLKSYAKETI